MDKAANTLQHSAAQWHNLDHEQDGDNQLDDLQFGESPMKSTATAHQNLHQGTNQHLLRKQDGNDDLQLDNDDLQLDDLQLDDLRLEESPMGSTATAHQNLLHSQACGEENHVQSELDSLARRRRFGLDIDRAEMTIREKRLRWRQPWIVYDNFKRKSLIHS